MQEEIDLLLSQSSNLILSALLYSDEAIAEKKQRLHVAKWMDSVFRDCLGLPCISTGALLSNISILLPINHFGNTLLSQKELQLSFFRSKDNTSNLKWAFHSIEALCRYSSDIDTDKNNNEQEIMTVEKISYCPKQNLLEASVSDISVSVTPNDVASLAFVALVEELNKAIGEDSLLKRSILMVKTWCFVEAPSLFRQHRKGKELI